MQLRYMDFCPAICDLQFGRPQAFLPTEACRFTGSDPPLWLPAMIQLLIDELRQPFKAACAHNAPY